LCIHCIHIYTAIVVCIYTVYIYIQPLWFVYTLYTYIYSQTYGWVHIHIYTAIVICVSTYMYTCHCGMYISISIYIYMYTYGWVHICIRAIVACTYTNIRPLQHTATHCNTLQHIDCKYIYAKLHVYSYTYAHRLQVYLYDGFHWKCYTSEIHRIEKLKFLMGARRYRFKWARGGELPRTIRVGPHEGKKFLGPKSRTSRTTPPIFGPPSFGPTLMAREFFVCMRWDLPWWRVATAGLKPLRRRAPNQIPIWKCNTGYWGIWVSRFGSRFGGFRGRSVFIGNYHTACKCICTPSIASIFIHACA